MIKKTYTFAFSIVLLVVILTSYFTYQLNKKIQIDETISMLEDMSDISSSQYDSILFNVCNTVKMALENIEKSSISKSELINILKEITINDYYVDSVHIIKDDKVFSSSDINNFSMTEFENVKDEVCDNKCSRLIQSSFDSNVFFEVSRYYLDNNEEFYLLVGINFDHVNQIVKPSNYSGLNSEVYFISNDGYILYHKNPVLRNRNLKFDKEIIKNYSDLDEENYEELIKNVVGIDEGSHDYFYYESSRILKIAFIDELEHFDGNVVVAMDSRAVVAKYRTLTFKILSPLLFCFFIICYIFVRYIYLIMYTDYFTELKNSLAFQKYLQKNYKRKNSTDYYVALRIDHVLDRANKTLTFDDGILHSFALRVKNMSEFYSKVFHISGFSYIFVLNEGIKEKNAENLVLELKKQIKSNMNVSLLEDFYVDGSIVLIESNGNNVEHIANMDEKIFKYMNDSGHSLRESKEFEFINIDDILNKFNKRTKDRIYIESIIENKEIVPFYQPIVNLNTKEILKHEVLMRTKSKDSPLNTPEIILIAEEENLVEKIDYSIIEQAFVMYKKRFDSTGVKTPLSINLSCKSIHQDMVSFILNMTKKMNIDTSSITFELTETAAIDHLSNTIHYLDILRAYGFLIAIDDFGTGYAHVELLSKLSVDYVKIDGVFVTGIENNTKKLKTLSALVYLAKIYDAKVIAEFVENESEIKVLKSLNVEYAQGYYFGKPEPVVKNQI